MSLLTDETWNTKYDSDSHDLVKEFYVPALTCATSYNRATGYFGAQVLTLASRGLEGLIRNDGRMRLVVGCQLDKPEIEAIRKGRDLRDAVESRLLAMPLLPGNVGQSDALELLSWMISNGYLEVRFTVPCNEKGEPVAGEGIYHEKAGVIEDKAGNRLAFNGSINETYYGWAKNWESFHVFSDWGGSGKHVQDEVDGFARLWDPDIRHRRFRVVDIREAVEKKLLEFLPKEDRKPRRLQSKSVPKKTDKSPVGENLPTDARRLVWGFLKHAASMGGGGDLVGEATSVIKPWPHQVRAFRRMHDNWPPRLLIADEVGLGKTIEAGMVLRQSILSGRAQRILIMAPKAVTRQWQLELREKFNLNWPIYDGHRLSWGEGRTFKGGGQSRKVSRDDWHKEPFVIVASQLVRRKERAPDLLEHSAPWDITVLDEAHHARRRGAGGIREKGANLLLRLMQGLSSRTKGLLLLTATPMQVNPVEVWDLLALLGLPSDWTDSAFLDFFQMLKMDAVGEEAFENMTRLFQVSETHFGSLTTEEFRSRSSALSAFAAKKVIGALRDRASTPRKMLNDSERAAAIRIMGASTPVARLVSRHTRGLLRRYVAAGKIDSKIATRQVEDISIIMPPSERQLYEDMEDYISSTYNQAEQKVRSAVGFVMTIYRKRLASSFAALASTLGKHLSEVKEGQTFANADTSEDVADWADSGDAMDDDEVRLREQEALRSQEAEAIEFLLQRIGKLPTDQKAVVLLEQLKSLSASGYGQTMVFTQYTDTLVFLRKFLSENGLEVMCFSGVGGETLNLDGTWMVISRDEIKRRFKDGHGDVLLCTDAAAEGLNFQFCGALINYDMPWNPMKVEQRIGRIDRLGQRYDDIQIVNLHYKDTVETDVYMTLRKRIGLFSEFVGKLQPILSALPQVIENASLATRRERDAGRKEVLAKIEEQIEDANKAGFDLDEAAQADLEMPSRPRPLYDHDVLDVVIRRADLLPEGTKVEHLGHREYAYKPLGSDRELRVTTNPEYFDEHPDSLELWSPGSPVFPDMEDVADADEVRHRWDELRGVLWGDGESGGTH